jgi:hypothetical protein
LIPYNILEIAIKKDKNQEKEVYRLMIVRFIQKEMKNKNWFSKVDMPMDAQKKSVLYIKNAKPLLQ